MKATLKREINLAGDKFFCVYADDNICVKTFLYGDEMDKERSEENQLAKAMALCRRIEEYGTGIIAETIYETPKSEQ